MSQIWSNMNTGLHVKYPLFLSDFNETLKFWTNFLKMLKHQISRQYVQRKPSCSKRTDGRTEITTLIVAFRNFANAPMKDKSSVETQFIFSFRSIWLHVSDWNNPPSGHFTKQTKVKPSHYRLGKALRVPGGWRSQISRQSAHEGGKVVSPTLRPPLSPFHLC
jgi:hypothetical protein